VNTEPVDLFDPKTQEDWYPAYRKLLSDFPVYQMPGTDTFVISRYEDILTVVRDTDTFSNEPAKHGGEMLIQHPQARQYYVDHGLGKEAGRSRFTPLGIDPPEHRKYRVLIERYFQNRALSRRRATIEQVAESLIDSFAADGEVEFTKAFAEQLPVIVITTMLGFPLEELPRLRVWSAAWAAPFARGLTLEQELDVARKGVEFQDYIKSVIDQRRRDPQDDIITYLTQARYDDSRPLTDHEIASMVDHLFIGGNETTAFALASGMWLMLREPRIYRALLADPRRIPAFVEENLRLESPTQGLPRVVTKDTEIAGVKIPRGATVHIRFGAANRDERKFVDPEVLDLERANANRHLAFSQGEHTCPGAGLSRLEQTISFGRLLARLPNLRLTPGKNDFTHHPGLTLRALKKLYLSFDPE
jgi:cytochrome P450